MKPLYVFPMMIVSLGIGVFIGKSGSGKQSAADAKTENHNVRETKVVRPARADPFGGPSFSLKSMDSIRDLFKNQGTSAASARLALSAGSLSAAEIPALMEMIRQDDHDNHGDDEARHALMNVLFERWAAVDPSASVAFVTSCRQRSFRELAASLCFSSLAQADSHRAVGELANLPQGAMRSIASNEVLEVLADRDPAAACDLYEKESISTLMGDCGSNGIFFNWAKTDPQAAAARLAALAPDKRDGSFNGELAAGWAQKDPEAALKWAKSLKPVEKNGAIASVYRVCALQDPMATWEKLKGEPGHLRGELIGGVIDVVADEDPRKAVSMLKGLKSKSEMRFAANQLLDRLHGYETRLAFELTEQLDDPAIRKQALGSQMFFAAWQSPELFKEQAAKMSDRERIETGGSVVIGLTDSDPAAAEKYFLSLPETQRSAETLENMMEHYCYQDAGKALDFAVSLSNPQEQTAAVKELFNTWSQADPEAAAAGWKRLPAGQSRLEALDRIANSWSECDPESAMEWAGNLSGTERARALAAVLPAMARDNPAAAASQLAALIASPPDGMGKNLASSANQLASRWASDDPAAASKWADSLPDGQSRDEGLKAVSQSWSQYDAIATAEWLGTLEAGSSRDAAIQPLVEQVRKTDPNTAFSWAASISDENERLNQLRETLKSWRGSDLKAARAAFGAADLPAKDRENLAKELE